MNGRKRATPLQSAQRPSDTAHHQDHHAGDQRNMHCNAVDKSLFKQQTALPLKDNTGCWRGSVRHIDSMGARHIHGDRRRVDTGAVYSTSTADGRRTMTAVIQVYHGLQPGEALPGQLSLPANTAQRSVTRGAAYAIWILLDRYGQNNDYSKWTSRSSCPLTTSLVKPPRFTISGVGANNAPPA